MESAATDCWPIDRNSSTVVRSKDVYVCVFELHENAEKYNTFDTEFLLGIDK